MEKRALLCRKSRVCRIGCERRADAGWILWRWGLGRSRRGGRKPGKKATHTQLGSRLKPDTVEFTRLKVLRDHSTIKLMEVTREPHDLASLMVDPRARAPDSSTTTPPLSTGTAGAQTIDHNRSPSTSSSTIASEVGPQRKRITRACDQCSHRRIKCLNEGAEDSTCFPCEKAQLGCTYLKEPKHRGPKRKRVESLTPSTSTHSAAPPPMAAAAQSQFLGQSAHAIASTSRIPLPSHHSVIAAPPQANGANNTNPFPSHLLNAVGAPASVPEVSTDPSSEQQSVYDALSLFTGPHNQTVPSYGADNYAWTDSAMLKFDFNLLSALELGQDELRVTEPFETDHEHLFHHPSRMTTGSTSFGSDANAHQIRSASTSYLGTPTHSASSPSTSLPLDEHMPHYFTVYFDRFWQLFPIVNRQRLTAQVQANEHRRPGPIAQLVLSIAALVETSDYLENSPHDGDPMNTRVGPVLSYARTTVFSPLREEDVQLDQVIAVMNLFVAEDILGNRRAGWYRLQEAITLAQVLQLDQIPQHARALDGSDQAAIEGLKTFYILFICERATSMLQRLPTIVHRPLRLPDNAYQLTQQRLSALPPSLFSGFPMPHLRLFSLINSQVLSCWHGTCSVAPNGCTAWSVDKALALQRDLANEFTSALNMYRSALNAVPSTNGIQNVNLVVTTAWLRDRFWNICQAHGLVHRDSGPELSPAYPFKILRELVDLFDHFKSSDTDAALDWGAKLYDMAMTGIRIVSQEQLVITPKSTSPNSVNESIRSPLKQQLMPILFKILGLLTMYKHAQDKLLPNLVKALATIS